MDVQSISGNGLPVLGNHDTLELFLIAADVMQPVISVTPEDDLRTAAQRMLGNALRELLVLGPDEQVVGFLDETRITELWANSSPSSRSFGEAAAEARKRRP